MTQSASPHLPFTSLWERQKGPEIEAYIKAGGYGAALDTARRGGREVIRLLRDAHLRSLDGDGQPVFMEWRACQAAPAANKYVLCAAGSPTPDFPVFRQILTQSPHLVIEGMILGALAVGAEEGFIYIIEEDYSLLANLEKAISEAHAHGFLGEDALLDINILTGNQAFHCRDARLHLAHLEELIEKKASVSRGKSPSGLFGWPTIIHNPETWGNSTFVLDQGPKWYQELGQDTPGGKLIHLSGPVQKTGIHEVPMGIAVKEIIDQYGGGLEDGVFFKALQFGGDSGGYLPESLLDLPLDFEALAQAGVSMGSGELKVLDDSVCMVAHSLELAYKSLDSFSRENPKAAEILNHIKRLLGEIEEGTGTRNHLATLEKVGSELLLITSTGSERSLARPVLTALTYFNYDFIHHVEQGVCATGKRRGLSTAPCQAACPAGIDVPTYLALIAEGSYEDAIRVIREDNPLPWICGTICTHPCEAACTRAEMDQPISIMALKGFAAASVMASGGYPKPTMEVGTNQKVAVVGSGPAGLSAAYFLARKGFKVTIFEALPVAGGVLSVGIPEYRLPIAVVQQEVENILNLGVELKTGVRIGRDLTLDELREQGYEAFFLGVGAHEGLRLNLEGEDSLHPVTDVMTFLRQVRMGRKKPLGDKVVIIGGGNAAIDAARTSIRLGSGKVVIAYRRTRREMPAWEAEIVQAEEEGVEIRYLTIPKRVVGIQGKVGGLECIQAELGEADASGRRRPVPIPDSDYLLEVDSVIAAIGQMPDVQCLVNSSDLKVNTRSRIVVDSQTLQTNLPDVFSGGDVVTGPATVVQAVGAGKWAALSIEAYLKGNEIPLGPPLKTPRMRLDPVEVPTGEKVDQPRAKMPLLKMEQRQKTFKRVELGLDEEAARLESLRCLRCDLCVGCGLCQAVCEEMGVKGLHLSATAEGRLALTDFHRPARRCIGCGSCVQVCPHKNIRMHDEGEQRRIVFCGTETANLTLETCDECGAPLAPQAYLSYLRNMTEDEPSGVAGKKLCPECARKHWAKGQMGDTLWFPPAG